MTRQTINLPFRSLKHDSIGQATGPDDAALDGVAGHSVGNTFNQDDAHPNTGTFYMQTGEARGEAAIQLKVREAAHIFFTFQTTDGRDITPGMSPEFKAYRAYRWQIDLTWTYDEDTKVYALTLADDAEYAPGYMFLFDADLPNTSQTQYPDKFLEFSMFSGARIAKSETVVAAELYWGCFEFMLSDACGDQLSNTQHCAVYDSNGRSILPSYPDYFSRSSNPLRVYLPWKQVIDPAGYWVEYSYDISVLTQYPGKYKAVDKQKPADLIPVGCYTDVVPHYEVSYWAQALSENQVLIEEVPSSPSCHTLDGGTWIRDVASVDLDSSYPDCCSLVDTVFRLDQGADEAGPYYRYITVKISVPYTVRYRPYYSMSSGKYEIGTYEWPHGGVCDHKNATARITSDQGNSIKVTNHQVDHPPNLSESFPGSCVDNDHHAAVTFSVADNHDTFVFGHVWIGYLSVSIDGT